MIAARFPARLATILAALTFLSSATAEGPAAKPKPDGVHQTFDEKGKLIAEETYLNGVLNGPAKKWDGRGTLLQEGMYKNGKMDGIWREYLANVWLTEKTYRDGVLHGPYRSVLPKTRSTEGQYVEGERDGEWVKLSLYGKSNGKAIHHFRRGIRDGKWLYTSNDIKEPIQITFKDGLVRHAPPELKDLPLLKRIDSLAGPDKPRDPLTERIVEALFEPCDLDYPETPLKEVTQDVVERFALPVCLDYLDLKRNRLTLEAPVTIKSNGAPLILGLTRIAQLHGLTLDYRYHGIWLTRQDTAEHWKGDPTGAMTLAPPKGSPLEKALEQISPVGPGRPEPKDLLTMFEEQGVKLEISAAAAARQLRDHAQGVRYYSPRITTREMLAVTLYQSGCVCSQKQGTLIIVPQTPVQ